MKPDLREKEAAEEEEDKYKISSEIFRTMQFIVSFLIKNFYKSDPEELMKIFVGNLSHEVNEKELSALFAEHGSVSSVKIIRDMSSQMSRGFGFVEMPRKVDAKKAVNSLNELEVKGKKLVVNEARPKRDRNDAGSGKKFSSRRR